MPVNATERLTPRAHQIAHAARELIEAEGLEALTMRSLASRLGIRAPSLYKHFDSKEALEAVLISIGFEEQAEQFEAALEGSDVPIIAMAEAYRAYARHHPQLYRLMYDHSLDRSLLLPGSEESAVVPVLRAVGGNRDIARALWAFAHGMIILELNSRFPPDADLDTAWDRGLAAFQRSIPARRPRR